MDFTKRHKKASVKGIGYDVACEDHIAQFPDWRELIILRLYLGVFSETKGFLGTFGSPIFQGGDPLKGLTRWAGICAGRVGLIPRGE